MVSDGWGRPLSFFLSPGQISDARGALVLLAELPAAKRILGDRGYDADWLREELKHRGLRVCIPARRGRRRLASHNRKLYKKRCRIENAFARLKDWRAIATRLTPAAPTSSSPPSASPLAPCSGCGSES
jgi:transposase